MSAQSTGRLQRIILILLLQNGRATVDDVTHAADLPRAKWVPFSIRRAMWSLADQGFVHVHRIGTGRATTRLLVTPLF